MHLHLDHKELEILVYKQEISLYIYVITLFPFLLEDPSHILFIWLQNLQFLYRALAR